MNKRHLFHKNELIEVYFRAGFESETFDSPLKCAHRCSGFFKVKRGQANDEKI